jgi:adenine-specific DNA-methyltransferase
MWVNDTKNNLTGGEKPYALIDDCGKVYRTVSMAAPDKPETRSHRPLLHPMSKKPCPVPQKGWRFPDKTMDRLLEEGKLLFGSDETTQPQQKYLLEENLREAVSSLLYFGGSDDALGLPFENPKPVYVASKIIESVCREDGDLILDFFAGSSTAAHAVMQLNSEDNKNRHFIMVQLPEMIDKKSEAFKAGYKNIAEISKERIRRAAKKIKEENPDYKGDLGFKALKLDSSNIKTWEAGFDSLKEDLFNAVDYIKQDRSKEDILYELLLKYGLDLTVPIEAKNIAGKTVYSVGLGALIVCLESDIASDVVHGIVELKEQLKPEVTRVVFKDSGFKDDVVKTNALQILKRAGIEDVKSL